jgi:hypothetical protein
MSFTNSNAFQVGRAYDVLEGRNRIINGDCRIAQRGSVSVTSNSTNTYGGPDRYIGIITGAGGAFTQSQGTMTINGVARPCVTQTSNTIATNLSSTNFWSGISQYIEGFNAFDLAFSPISISFWFNATLTATYGVALRDGASSNSYVTTFNYTAGSPQKVIINIPQPTVALTIPDSTGPGMYINIAAINGGTYATGTFNAWQSGNFFAASTSAQWSQTVNAFVSVAELQLEQGSVASTFERRSAAHELMLCQRYYQSVSPGAINGMTYTSNGDTRCTVKLNGTMRVAPSVTVSSSSLNVVGFGTTVTTGVSNSFVNVALPINTIATSIDSVYINNTTTTNISSSGTIAIWSTSGSPTFFCSAEY